MASDRPNYMLVFLEKHYSLCCFPVLCYIENMKKHYPRITWSRTPILKMTAEQIAYAKERLRDAWLAELPEQEVYTFTGLSKEDIDFIKERDPAFAELERECYGILNIQSRLNIADNIHSGEVPTSKWYLEKTDPSFQKRGPLLSDDAVVITVEDRQKAIRDMLAGLSLPDDTSMESGTQDASDTSDSSSGTSETPETSEASETSDSQEPEV